MFIFNLVNAYIKKNFSSKKMNITKNFINKKTLAFAIIEIDISRLKFLKL